MFRYRDQNIKFDAKRQSKQSRAVLGLAKNNCLLHKITTPQTKTFYSLEKMKNAINKVFVPKKRFQNPTRNHWKYKSLQTIVFITMCLFFITSCVLDFLVLQQHQHAFPGGRPDVQTLSVTTTFTTFETGRNQATK